MPEFICPHCHAVFREKKSLCPADGSLLIEVPVLADLSGQVLRQKYKLDKALGHGGFGSVYKATHLVLGRPVAVKVLRAEFRSDTNMVARFFNEARVVTRLTNPHTINPFDLDQTADGLLFMVMDFIQGVTLRRLAKDEGDPPGRLPWRRTLRLLIQVCDSLEEAHREGVVHRDLKPDNVMVSNRGGEPDFVTVLDFGIAKVLEGADMASLTTAGMILGSPAYMSPEQVKSTDITALSDIYSLGAVAFHALSGTLPVNARQTAAILQEKIHSEPVPITRKTPDVTVPLELEELLVRMLALEPGDRPRTAAEVKEEFVKLLQRYAGVPDDKKSYQAAFAAPPAGDPGTEPGTRGYDGMPLEGEAQDFALEETLVSRVHDEMTEDDDAEPESAGPVETPVREEVAPAVLPEPPRSRRLLLAVTAITAALALVAVVLIVSVQFGGKKTEESPADNSEPAAKKEPAPEPGPEPKAEAHPASALAPHPAPRTPFAKERPAEDHSTPTAREGPSPGAKAAEDKQPEKKKEPAEMKPEEKKEPEEKKQPVEKDVPAEKLPDLPIDEGDGPVEEAAVAPAAKKKEPTEDHSTPTAKEGPAEDHSTPTAKEGPAEDHSTPTAKEGPAEDHSTPTAKEGPAPEEEAAKKKAEEEAAKKKAEEEYKKSEEEMNNLLNEMGGSGPGGSDPTDDMFKEMEDGPNW